MSGSKSEEETNKAWMIERLKEAEVWYVWEDMCTSFRSVIVTYLAGEVPADWKRPDNPWRDRVPKEGFGITVEAFADRGITRELVDKLVRLDLFGEVGEVAPPWLEFARLVGKTVRVGRITCEEMGRPFGTVYDFCRYATFRADGSYTTGGRDFGDGTVEVGHDVPPRQVSASAPSP